MYILFIYHSLCLQCNCVLITFENIEPVRKIMADPKIRWRNRNLKCQPVHQQPADLRYGYTLTLIYQVCKTVLLLLERILSIGEKWIDALLFSVQVPAFGSSVEFLQTHILMAV